MRKTSSRRFTGAVTAVFTLLAAGVAPADDAGVVRITDQRPASVVRISDRPVIRGQSPSHLNHQVEQTALFSLCPDSLDCDSICCDPGCTTGGSCPSYHSCPSCSPCGMGHSCPIVGWMVHLLDRTHEMKVDMLTRLGIPCHCCRDRQETVRCRRQRVRSFVCRSPDWRKERRERLGLWLSHSRLNYFIPRGCCGKGCPPCGHYTIVYPVDPWYGDCRDGHVYAAEGIGGPVSVPLAPVIRHTYNYGWGVPSSRLTPISHLATGPVYGRPYGYPAMPWAPSESYHVNGAAEPSAGIASRY